MAFKGDPVRVLVMPGLYDSGPTHWHSWLESHFRHSRRVQQEDWSRADLPVWSRRIEQTLAAHPHTRWVAVAHSFGCLALAHFLAHQAEPQQGGIEAALLVAPADTEKFGVVPLLPASALAIPSVLIGSESDLWMPIEGARSLARNWKSQFINLGDVGHINVESGFGPLPPAKTLTQLPIHRVERSRRLERAHPVELSFSG